MLRPRKLNEPDGRLVGLGLQSHDATTVSGWTLADEVESPTTVPLTTVSLTSFAWAMAIGMVH